MSKLFTELSRRNVFRAGIAYTVVAWIIAQVFDLMVDNFGAPDWVMKVILLFLIAGLPIALIFAWAFELTPDGVKKTQEVPVQQSITPNTGRTLNRITTTALILLVAFIAWDKLWPENETSTSTATEKSVAVLPFADLSELQDQEWFADGLTEEILNSLARLPELQVTARTSSFAFKGQNTDISEIADALGVANIVEGSVRRIGNDLRVTAQLIRAHDGIHLWSETYDSTTENLFDVQHDVAENIASTLDVILDDEKRDRMFSYGTRNVGAFEAYMRGRELFSKAHDRSTSDVVTLADANEYFELAMELDPTFGPPAMLHSDRYAHRLIEGPSPIVGDDHDLDVDTVYAELMADLKFAERNARDDVTRTVAELNYQFWSPSWHRVPGLISELKELTASGASLQADNLWLSEILTFFQETELLRAFADVRMRHDPLARTAWTDMADVNMSLGKHEEAADVIDEARRRLGDNFRLREQRLRVALFQGDHETAIDLMQPDFLQSVDYLYYQPILAYLQGDTEKAAQLVDQIQAEYSWPHQSLEMALTLIGDRERARESIGRVDALPAGPTVVAIDLSIYGGLFWYSLDDTPKLKAMLEEAGMDVSFYELEPTEN